MVIIMKKAVMYGAGNIGRGFVGALLAQTGYEVTFIDIAQEVVAQLREERQYPVRIVSDSGSRDEWIKNVTAIDARDEQAVAGAIAGCDIMATAVGARILALIVPNLVAGIKKRFQDGNGPLDILICENLMDANEILKEYISENLTEQERDRLNNEVGFVETSIGRMVPVQTPEMKDGHPLRVCVESYGFLPVDRDAFRGDIPDNPLLKPFSPFDFYIKRKLFLHNMGHAVCAFLGNLKGYSYIHETINDAQIRIIVQNAMEESSLALAAEYDVDLKSLTLHRWDLLNRFANSALGDTCARVANDPKRKLGKSDRLIGAASLMKKNDITPAYIFVGIASAVHALLDEADTPQTIENATRVLEEELTAQSPLLAPSLEIYELIKSGESLHTIEKRCARMRADEINNI